MKKRVTSESESTVSLFPFLAVLLCTMGALLVLLVVLAQRAGQRVVEQPEPAPVVTASIEQDSAASKQHEMDTREAERLQAELEKVLAYREKLTQLRKQAEQRMQDEKQRLTHLEEHTRRLEHELARLALAAEQLLATESKQQVDQEQAEQELERLQQLIAETELQLEDLREQGQGKHSYAIVPYQGQYGTFRKPLYIECSKQGVIIQPEGISLKWSDFVATSLPSNPLAAAVRATRDHLNAQAARAGAPQPPDPYPLLIVRPSGIKQYQLARAALSSYDENYGYEFVDEDWQLSYPDLPDPQLANVQQHAIMLARERLERLIRSAPRRFGGVGVASSNRQGYGNGMGGAGGYGSGESSNPLAQGDGYGGGGAPGGWGAGESEYSDAGSADRSAQSESTAPQFGAYAEGTTKGGEAQWEGNSETGGGLVSDGTEQVAGQATTRNSTAGHSQGSLAQGQAASAPSGSAEGGSGNSSGGGALGGASTQKVQGNSFNSATSSIAESHGQNWATPNKARGAIPLRRTLEVVVRENQIALLPNRHVARYDSNAGQVISLDQSSKQIADQLVSAMRNRIDEWGLAGSGLYWRPVMKMNVGPNAGPTAERVVRLLKDSGVEISLPETARAAAGGANHVPQ